MSIFKFCFCFESLAGFWWPLDNLKCFYSHQKTSLAQRPALLLCMDKISVLIYILLHSLSHESSICRNLLTLSSLRLDPHGNSMTFKILCAIVLFSNCEVSHDKLYPFFFLFFKLLFLACRASSLFSLVCVKQTCCMLRGELMLEDTQSY